MKKLRQIADWGKWFDQTNGPTPLFFAYVWHTFMIICVFMIKQQNAECVEDKISESEIFPLNNVQISYFAPF